MTFKYTTTTNTSTNKSNGGPVAGQSHPSPAMINPPTNLADAWNMALVGRAWIRKFLPTILEKLNQVPASIDESISTDYVHDSRVTIGLDTDPALIGDTGDGTTGRTSNKIVLDKESEGPRFLKFPAGTPVKARVEVPDPLGPRIDTLAVALNTKIASERNERLDSLTKIERRFIDLEKKMALILWDHQQMVIQSAYKAESNAQCAEEDEDEAPPAPAAKRSKPVDSDFAAMLRQRLGKHFVTGAQPAPAPSPEIDPTYEKVLETIFKVLRNL